ncbi:hypothetical protein F4821DRAFT_244979 [Hypoxylon rubiginosum]|uniref:Uncharacterized protein n=1 Tax=Hypoxylon rubiginosum TaxID=110542 RepID=A0ACC0CSF9_9PEZI|nr:hypothetical protein F4821DRAFT_244979 [Hypoxylon rubiginosum]
MSSDGLKSWPLPSAAARQLREVASWLQSEKAAFHLVNSSEICGNKDGMVDVTSRLIAAIAAQHPSDQSASIENRVAAIHFDTLTVIPVDQGWAMYLIPVHAVKGTIIVDGQQLNMGHYCHLKETFQVEGDFYAVLILCRRGQSQDGVENTIGGFE